MHTGASYRRSWVITGPSHLGVYGPCVFIRCVIEKAKKTAQLGSKSSAFDGRVLLGLDRLGLNPVSQRHVTSGSCAGVWLIGCDPTDETDRCCSECGAAGRVRSSWRRRLYLVKSMFRVSSLIFLAVKNTAEPAQQTLKQYRHQHRLERVPHTGRMAVERLDRRTHILAYNSILAYSPKGGVSCSLDRSDTYPCCQNGNLFIMPHSADLANRSFAELDSAWDNAILCEIAMGQTMSRLTVRIGQLRKSEFFNYQNPNIGGGRSGDGATLH